MISLINRNNLEHLRNNCDVIHTVARSDNTVATGKTFSRVFKIYRRLLLLQSRKNGDRFAGADRSLRKYQI